VAVLTLSVDYRNTDSKGVFTEALKFTNFAQWKAFADKIVQ